MPKTDSTIERGPSLDTLDSLVRLPHWTKVPRGRCNSPQDIPCYFHGEGYCFAHHFCTAWESEPNEEVTL